MAMHEDSIVDTVKTMLNIELDDDTFDVEVMIHINSTFATLNQLGVGPPVAVEIEDKTVTWAAFIGLAPNLSSVKTLMYYRCRLAFDPPSTSYAIQSFEKMAEELEWRLMVAAKPPEPLDVVQLQEL